MQNILKRYQSNLLVLGFFALLTFLALDNLILHMGTAIPEPGSSHKDYAVFYWDLWWVKYALVNLHTDPLITNYILFPNTVNLSLHTHVFTLGLVSMPFQLFMDMHWIVNGLIILSFLASSTLMFIFLRRHANNTWLSLLGATVYAFSPGMIWRATQVHLNTLAIWWLPLALLLWDLALERRSVRWSLVLGGSIYLAFMNYSELVLWILLTLSPYMLYGLLIQPTWHARRQVIGLGCVAALAAFLPTLVIPLPQLQLLGKEVYPWEDIRFVRYFSFPITALFTRQEVPENNTLGQTLPVLVLISLALTGKRRERWLWLGTGLVSLILALGPDQGNPSRPLPFMLLYDLFHGQYREPIRLTTPATLALVTFAVWSFANLFDRLPNQRMQAIIGAALMVVYIIDVGLLAPFPITTAPDYPVYNVIGADPENHTLLQVPIGAASGNRWIGGAEQLQYYARFHHQRTVNGLISRLPGSQLDRYLRSAFLMALARENPLPPFEEARAELVRRLKNWDIRYIVVHKDLLKAEEIRSFIEFFNQQPELCVFDDDVNTIAYRAISSWADCPTPDLTTLPPNGKLDLGEPGDYRFVGQGWYDIENIGGPQGRWTGEIATSTLRLVIPAGSTRIRFRVLAYPANQSVVVSVNGQKIGEVNLANDWADYELTVPADALHTDGPSLVTLDHARLESAFDRTGGVSQDRRLLAAAYDYFVFEPAH